MSRTDSAFDETFRLEVSSRKDDKPAQVHRSNTAPTRHRNLKRTSPDLASTFQSPPTIGNNHPASEKPSNGKSGEPRRISIASSDNSTTKSHRRGHNSTSLPSSRRTSCTVVDPARPTRHYRIKSSQTCPTVNRDIDDVLALHFRSCSLFQNPTYHSSGLPSPTISGYGVVGPDTDFGSTRGRPGTAPQTSQSKEGAVVAEPLYRKESEETVGIATTHEAVDMTMHWISPGTRRTQYERIDRANSGFRGFFRRVTPRCVSGPPTQKFYEHDKSDAGSVRRYRMDVDDEEHEDEKGNSALRMQRRKLERSTMRKTGIKTKRWACF